MRQSKTVKAIQNFEDARYFAHRRLPRFLYHRYEAGSAQGLTLERNVAAFEEVQFRPKAATFSSKRDLRTTVLGTEVSMPVLLAPIGVLRIGHVAGETGAAVAAGAAGTVSVVSSSTGTPIEEICAAATGPIFYQLHYFGGRQSAESMIERAKQSGCKALIVTVDSQGRMAARERPYRERSFAPESLHLEELVRILPQVLTHPAWLYDFLRSRKGLEIAMAPTTDGKPLQIFHMLDALYERTPIWEDLPWIRSQWDGPLGVKGILTPEDARRAVSLGADAIVVSNHGGNGLDGRPATLPSLPRIVDSVGVETEILLDGGIRRGADAVKAVAMGARAVLIGRAYVFGLLAAGEPGVERVLQIMRQGIDNALAFLDCPSVKDLNADAVIVPKDWRP
jgi:isopentenyl diphosphate isomerase/L-lactate dehydrogenase-like FMN-dependent dehydrogenase